LELVTNEDGSETLFKEPLFGGRDIINLASFVRVSSRENVVGIPHVLFAIKNILNSESITIRGRDVLKREIVVFDESCDNAIFLLYVSFMIERDLLIQSCSTNKLDGAITVPLPTTGLRLKQVIRTARQMED
jgi:hypothetical protein